MSRVGGALRAIRASLGRVAEGRVSVCTRRPAQRAHLVADRAALPGSGRAGPCRVRPVRRRDGEAAQPRGAGPGRLRAGTSPPRRDRLERGGASALEPPADEPRRPSPSRAGRGCSCAHRQAGARRRDGHQLLAPLLRDGRLGYRLSPATDLFDRVHAMRVVSALLVAATVFLSFLFLRELLPSTPWVVARGRARGGLPAALRLHRWWGQQRQPGDLRRGGDILRARALLQPRPDTEPRSAPGRLRAVGLLAKPSMVGLLPGVALGVGIMILRATPDARRRALLGAAAAAAAAAIPCWSISRSTPPSGTGACSSPVREWSSPAMSSTRKRAA